MIVIIVCIAVIAVGVILFKWDTDFVSMGLAFAIGGSMGLLISLGAYFSQAYEYGIFAAKRDAFTYSLNEARKQGNDYETAAIVKEVCAWNILLAEKKYKNSHWLEGQFIDDRFDELEPIK